MTHSLIDWLLIDAMHTWAINQFSLDIIKDMKLWRGIFLQKQLNDKFKYCNYVATLPKKH